MQESVFHVIQNVAFVVNKLFQKQQSKVNQTNKMLKTYHKLYQLRH